MNRFFPPITALILGVLVALAMASCGGSNSAELLPGDTADAILQNLDEVDQLVIAGDCSAALQAADEVSRQIKNLDPQVNRQLRQRLVEGAAHLKQLTQDPNACAADQTDTTEVTTNTDTETVVTDTETATDTVPVQTDTVPVTTDTAPVEVTETTTPPETTTQTTTTPPPTVPPPTTPTTGGLTPNGKR